MAGVKMKKLLARGMLLFSAGCLLFPGQSRASAKAGKTWEGGEAVTREFGEYLKELVENDRWGELERYVISRVLTREEAAALADRSPAFANFAEYGEYFYSSGEAVIAEADVNGDGRPDIIEYLPDVGEARYVARSSRMQQNMLTVFEGGEQTGVLYFQPWFDTPFSSNGELLVAEYRENVFFLFRMGGEIAVYRMKDGKFTDRLRIEAECRGAETETVECKDGFRKDAEVLSDSVREYFGEDGRSSLFMGSAEILLDEDSGDYTELGKISEEEAGEYSRRYSGQAGGKDVFFSPAAGYSGAYICRCDIDNDGENELYAKAKDDLNLKMMTGNGWHAFMTGELYGGGRHEGKYGLNYTMIQNGERTDFKEICGLDIWDGEETPQMFWVDKKECGNITYIQYEDTENWGRGRIEAYDIRDGNYEKVLEVRYMPVYSFEEEYEKNRSKGGELSYAVRISVKGGAAEIFGMGNRQLQERINSRIKSFLWEKLLERMNRGDAPLFDGQVECNVVRAEEKRLVLRFLFVYGYEGVEHGCGEGIGMEISLMDGTVRLTDVESIEPETEW